MSANGEIPREMADRILDLSNALDDAYPGKKLVKETGIVEKYAPGTVFQYIHTLKRWYVLDGIDYLTANSSEVNRLARKMDTGRHPEAPDGGYSRQTVNKFLCAAKAFYDYHQDLDIPRSEVEMFKKTSRPAYDDQDMFTRDEINALRDAVPDVRRRALLEMLIYTGQRIRALLTLRIKDIDATNGYFYLNEDADGLKGATKRGRKRPLFGARKYVRDWIQHHPLKDDPEAFVFIGDPSNHQTKTDKPLTERSARRILQRARDEAGIETSVSPHKFRHYFVSVMSNDYGLDDNNIKFLMGHAKNSNVMNTTYKHIKSDDYINRAEAALGYKRPETRNSFVPEDCRVCGEDLEEDWKSCPNCGEVYAPDAEATKHQITEAMFESALETSNPEEQQALQVVQQWIEDHPGDAAEVLSEAMMNEEDGRNA